MIHMQKAMLMVDKFQQWLKFDQEREKHTPGKMSEYVGFPRWYFWNSKKAKNLITPVADNEKVIKIIGRKTSAYHTR